MNSGIAEFNIDSWTTLETAFCTDGLDLSEDILEEVREVKRFLTMFQDLAIPFLVILPKNDPPDIEFILGEKERIGLEVTRAADESTESWLAAESHLGKETAPDYGSVARNWLEGKNLHSKRLNKYLVKRQGDSCIWGAREQAQAKASEVIKSVKKKYEEYGDKEFSEYRDLWLLVWDPVPFLFLDIPCFQELVNDEISSTKFDFNRVFFSTQLINRKNGTKPDTLFEISSKGCYRIK